MATVLAYTTPAMGHLFPISELLSELRDRGHDIALRTLAAGVDTGLGLGFATAAVDPRIETMPLDDADAPNPKVALQKALSTFARHAEYEVTDLAAAIDEVGPDVVLVDANCWGAAAGAEASGLPWLSFGHSFLTCDRAEYRRGVLGCGRGRVWLVGFATRCFDRW